MWLYCKSGFFSAVKNVERKDAILLRARFKGDLERLLESHGVKAKVSHTPKNDYAYRTTIKSCEWTRIVAEEADAIDYGNFKDEVHDGTVRDEAYMDTWCAMRQAQDMSGSRKT